MAPNSKKKKLNTSFNFNKTHEFLSNFKIDLILFFYAIHFVQNNKTTSFTLGMS